MTCVVSTTAGYTGGFKKDPTYEEVSTGRTGHAESAQVTFDPAKISYDKLLEVYWHNIDPTQKDGQFCDHGSQYRTVIFYANEAQKNAVDLIAVATQGRGGIKRLFLGSVADKVVRGAATPVLVYRPVDKLAPAGK